MAIFSSASLRDFPQRDLGEVNVHCISLVEIVGEDVHRDVADDLGDFAIVEAGIADGSDGLVANGTLALYHLMGEPKCDGRAHGAALAIAAAFDLAVGQPDQLADCAVSR